jgi:hypothetical protein
MDSRCVLQVRECVLAGGVRGGSGLGASGLREWPSGLSGWDAVLTTPSDRVQVSDSQRHWRDPVR